MSDINKRKLVIFIASSLDGYIATDEHNLDWLFSVEGEGDNGYSDFYESIDTILMGRVTYDWLMEHEKDNFPYEGKECYVFSRMKKENSEHVSFVQDNIGEFSKELKRKQGKNIWLVGGGDLIQTFINEKLVDEIIVTIAPVLLGKGIPLFKNNHFQTSLLLKSINRYNQFAELHYEVVR
jgi:dihydrofolate reductase